MEICSLSFAYLWPGVEILGEEMRAAQAHRIFQSYHQRSLAGVRRIRYPGHCAKCLQPSRDVLADLSSRPFGRGYS